MPTSLQGGYTTAKVSAEEAYELRRGCLGEDDNFTRGSLSLLAVALKAQDKYEEAAQNSVTKGAHFGPIYRG